MQVMYIYPSSRITYIHTYHSRFIPEGVGETFYQNYLDMRNTADVKGGKSVAVWSIYLNKKISLQYPLSGYKDLSIHSNRKREAT
jgi:hypothetical protein